MDDKDIDVLVQKLRTGLSVQTSIDNCKLIARRFSNFQEVKKIYFTDKWLETLSVVNMIVAKSLIFSMKIL